MSDTNAQNEAKTLAAKASEQAKQSRSQAKASAKTSGQALKVAAEPVVENATDIAQDVAASVEETVKEIPASVRRLTPQGFSNAAADAGLGFLAMAVSIYAGTIAFKSLKHVATGRSFLVKPPA